MEENQNQQTEQQEQTEQIETVEKAQYDTLMAELEELKGKVPKTPTDTEKAILDKQKELFDKEVSLTLKENNLEQFASVLKVSDTDELNEVVKSLTQIVNNIKVSTGYVPQEHAKQNEYDSFASKKDTKGMISTKLSKLFG